MKKLHNYFQFKINENILKWVKDKVLKTLSGWAGAFLRAVDDGQMRRIPSGPNKGKPVAMLFLPQNGSIVQQLRDYLNGGYTRESKVTEATIPIASTKVINQSANQIKQEIKDLYNTKVAIADAKSSEERRGLRAKPIFIYGAPGIGKTEIVASCADELNCALLFLDIQFMNPEDFKGIPSYHEIRAPKIEDGIVKDYGSGFTRSNPPSIFPRDNGDSGQKGVEGPGGIIFMDEMNRANRSVLNTLMQFVQMGRIDNYQLPSKWIIVAAGNRKEDDPYADIEDLGTALSSRFSASNFEAKAEDWVTWAQKEIGILPELVMFIKYNEGYFHLNDPDKNPGQPFPNPRSWTDASKILVSRIKAQGKSSWRDMSNEEITDIFHKEVGQEAAGKFTAYLNVLRSISDDDMNQMISDPLKAPIPASVKGNPSYIYGLSEMLFARIKSYDIPKLANIMFYINRYKEDEIVAWLYSRIRTKYTDFDKFVTDKNKETEDTKLKLKVGELLHSNAKIKKIVD